MYTQPYPTCAFIKFPSDCSTCVFFFFFFFSGYGDVELRNGVRSHNGSQRDRLRKQSSPGWRRSNGICEPYGSRNFRGVFWWTYPHQQSVRTEPSTSESGWALPWIDWATGQPRSLPHGFRCFQPDENRCVICSTYLYSCSNLLLLLNKDYVSVYDSYGKDKLFSEKVMTSRARDVALASSSSFKIHLVIYWTLNTSRGE